ncbi:MAG TPA: hypothetical protein VFY73_13045 [Ideonella sp.]|uniref:hypothetical protein n=1 Tax=Ideonella sp. TaxID=1929293 RepID=UPI002E37E27D|nr:hypothetical protein [Ideonella sp.]HEX5684943.1 hypothetical protein [Ideonella sp.]
MASALTSALVTAAVFVAAIVLNPSAEAHRDKIKQATSERSPIAGALGLGALTAFVSTYHSWGVASYTTANGKTLSWGAFGIVFVTEGSIADK